MLLLGITFKEDCPDIRNSKVIDIFRELLQFNKIVDVYDPHADKHEVKEEYGINLVESISDKYDAIVLAVSHKEFLRLDMRAICASSNSIIYDIKSFLERSIVGARL